MIVETSKNKIIKKKKTIISFCLIFLFFLIISFFTPISGDDWNNYLACTSNSFINKISNAIELYFTWEGRFISRILLSTLLCHKKIFNIIVSILITSYIYLGTNLFNKKNKSFILLMLFLTFLTLDSEIFTQSILWATGSITYLFPTVLIFIYLSMYYKYICKKSEYKWYIYIPMILFSFLITMFAENIAFAFVFLNLLLNIYEYIKNKKINKLLLCNLIFSFIGALIMLLSPGSAARTKLENESYEISFIKKIIEGCEKFIYFTFIRNYFLATITSIVNIQLMKKSKMKNILFNIINYISILLSIICMLNGIGINILPNLISFNKLTIIFWGVFILQSAYIYYISYRKNKYFMDYSLVILLGLSANLIMIPITVWGGRTTFFTTLILTLAYIYILNDLLTEKIKKYLNKALIVIICLISSIYLITYYNVYKFNKFQESSIKRQLENKDILNNQIIIYTLPERIIWDFIPKDDFHKEQYKKYYKMNPDINFKYVETKWKYGIIFIK